MSEIKVLFIEQDNSLQCVCQKEIDGIVQKSQLNTINIFLRRTK
jgi:hypothetical protein